MYFRLVSCTVDPAKVDETVAVFDQANAPGLAALPGFIQVLYGLNRKTGKVTTVTVWESEEHERASRLNVPNTIANMRGLLLAEEVHQETLEIVHAWPALDRA